MKALLVDILCRSWPQIRQLAIQSEATEATELLWVHMICFHIHFYIIIIMWQSQVDSVVRVIEIQTAITEDCQ